MGGNLKYLLVLMVMIVESCNGGVVHKVGESSGWTNINLTSSYYNSWTASKNFQVGDTICKSLCLSLTHTKKIA